MQTAQNLSQACESLKEQEAQKRGAQQLQEQSFMQNRTRADAREFAVRSPEFISQSREIEKTRSIIAPELYEEKDVAHVPK
jgi:hypothetical protein